MRRSPDARAPNILNPPAHWARIGFVGFKGLFGFEKHEVCVWWRFGPQLTQMTPLFDSIYFCDREINRAKPCKNFSFVVIARADFSHRQSGHGGYSGYGGVFQSFASKMAD
jgi:hypothetical protein